MGTRYSYRDVFDFPEEKLPHFLTSFVPTTMPCMSNPHHALTALFFVVVVLLLGGGGGRLSVRSAARKCQAKCGSWKAKVDLPKRERAVRCSQRMEPRLCSQSG